MKEKLYVVVKKEPIGHCFNLGQTVISSAPAGKYGKVYIGKGKGRDRDLEITQYLDNSQVELIGEI